MKLDVVRVLVNRRRGAQPATAAPWRQPRVLIAVVIGGMLGAPARYGIGLVIPDSAQQFPVGTLLVNLSGAFALGLLYGYLGTLRATHRHIRAFVGTGFIGSYTTFSTYVVQAVLLGHHGRYGVAIGYLALSLLLGLVAVSAGVSGGRRLGAGP